MTDPDRAGISSYVFANNKDDSGKPIRWNAKDIAEYLLAWYTPPDLTFKLGGAVDVLEKIEPPEFRVSGRTVFAALNHLFNRRRGLSWCVKPPMPPAEGDEGDDAKKFEIFISTTVDEDVTFDDFTLPANPDVFDIPVNSLDHLVRSNELKLDTLASYDRIIVSGEPLLVCCTVSFKDGVLEKAWDSDLENSYKAGVKSSSDDTTGWTPERFDEARTIEYWERVYTTFRLKKTWNFQAGDGAGGPKRNVSPSLTNDGRLQIDTAAPTRNWGHRITRHLPLRREKISGGAENNVAPEYIPPFVLLKNSQGRFQHSEKMGLDGSDDPNAGHVRMLDDDFGFEVSARPNHRLAKGTWHTGAAAKPTKVDPDSKGFDYRELIATIAFRTDTRLRVIADVAAPGQSAGAKPGRVLQLDVPNAELWWIAPNTVKGTKVSGELDRETRTGDALILRDDSPRLRRIATLAKAWYSKRRAAMSLMVNDISSSLAVGSYVKNVHDVSAFEPVNSVVTCVTYNVDTQTTTIQTQFSELDVVAGFGPSKSTLR